MATTDSRIAIVDIDQLSAAQAAAAINTEIETLETAGFVVREQRTVSLGPARNPKQFVLLLGLLSEHLDSSGVLSTLGSTANGDGASRVALEDPDDLLAAADAEAAIQEIAGKLCNVVVAAADATGGSTDSALTVDLKTLNGAALAKEGIVKVTVTGTQYAGEESLIATATFNTATLGSILASGNGWAVVKCDANGQFACTLANSADETDYVAASTPDGGVDALADAVMVVGCVPDDVTWAA